MPEKLPWGESLSVSLVSSIEQVLSKRGRISTISFKIFLSHSAKNFVREPYCTMFQKTYVSEKVMRKGWEESQHFPRKTFCLTLPKIFLGGNPLVFHYFRVQKNFRLERAEKESRLFVEKSLSHCGERFRREPFCAMLQNFLKGNVSGKTEGESVKIFRRKVFVYHSTKKFREGTLVCCVSEN